MTGSRLEINPNTVLLAILMGLSVWTLTTVSKVQTVQSGMTEQIKNLERVVYSVAK